MVSISSGSDKLHTNTAKGLAQPSHRWGLACLLRARLCTRPVLWDSGRACLVPKEGVAVGQRVNAGQAAGRTCPSCRALKDRHSELVRCSRPKERVGAQSHLGWNNSLGLSFHICERGLRGFPELIYAKCLQ